MTSARRIPAVAQAASERLPPCGSTALAWGSCSFTSAAWVTTRTWRKRAPSLVSAPSRRSRCSPSRAPRTSSSPSNPPAPPPSQRTEQTIPGFAHEGAEDLVEHQQPDRPPGEEVDLLADGDP